MPTASPPPAPPTFRPNLTALPPSSMCPSGRRVRANKGRRARRRRGRTFVSRAGAAAVFLFRRRLLPRALAAAEADSPRGWGAAACGSAGWEKNPGEARELARGQRHRDAPSHARTHGRRPELRPAAAQRRPRLHESKATTESDGSEPGRPGPGGNQAAVKNFKNVHETTSRRLKQTETGGLVVIQRMKLIARGMRF
jgi:hypothetical protein